MPSLIQTVGRIEVRRGSGNTGRLAVADSKTHDVRLTVVAQRIAQEQPRSGKKDHCDLIVQGHEGWLKKRPVVAIEWGSTFSGLFSGLVFPVKMTLCATHLD